MKPSSLIRPLLLGILLLMLSMSADRGTMAGQRHAARVDMLLQDMSLKQKVGQMFLVSLYGPVLTEIGEDLLRDWQPGGITLFPSNLGTPEDVARLTNSYQNAVAEVGGVPLFIAADQEGGIIQRLREGFTEWPPSSLLAAANDAELAARVGQRMGEELRAVGVNANLAPVTDLDTNVNNPIIGRRSPGSDLVLLDTMLRGYISGLQDAGVLATAKHFPGHGDTEADSHVALPRVDHNLERLQTVEMQPFVSATQADVGAVMVGHIWLSALDDSPRPASLSEAVTTGLLRDRIGYNGIIMTDALDMDAIDTNYAPDTAALMALKAGADLLTYGPGTGEATQIEVMQAVYDAVRRGEISEARVTESAHHILSAKASLGILDWSPVELASVAERIDLSLSDDLVAEVFRQGVTVAFDHERLIPVDAGDSVGIIYPGQRISINRVCRVHRGDVRWLSVSESPPAAEIEDAGDLAARVDTVIVFARSARDNTAYSTLIDSLPPEKTAVVALRSPYDVLAFPDVAAYMVTYGPQDPAIDVACGILFGALEARGQLPINLPGVDVAGRDTP